MIRAELLQHDRHLLQRSVEIREVRQPIFVDRIAFFCVVYSDPDRFGEIEIRRPFDIDDRFERNSNLRRHWENQIQYDTREAEAVTNLDTFSFILTTEYSFLDNLHPIIATRFSIRTKVPLLVGRRDFEVILVLERDFDQSAVVSKSTNISARVAIDEGMTDRSMCPSGKYGSCRAEFDQNERTKKS